MRDLQIWRDAAKGVSALWNSSDSIPRIIEDYCFLTDCPEEAYRSQTRKGEVIPYRFGMAYLMNKGLGLGMKDIIHYFESFSSHSSVSNAVQSFEHESKVLGIKFPQPSILSYPLRLTCKTIFENDWDGKSLEEILFIYSRATGLSEKQIKNSVFYHSNLSSTVRSGFFFLIAEQLRKQGFSGSPDIQSHHYRLISEAMADWKKIVNLDNPTQKEEDHAQRHLKLRLIV